MAAKIQKAAPSFKATAYHNGEFKELSSEDFKGKYLCLFFYPLDFTFVCPTEILAYSDKSDEFKKLGCEVVGCSIDSHFTHFAWANTPKSEGGIEGIKIPLLADLNKKIAKKFGVLTDGGVALRGTFIIDREGVVRAAHIHDLPLGRNVEEDLRTLKALQFFEENGEVCPAGWEEGADTIKPNLADSKEYFSKQG